MKKKKRRFPQSSFRERLSRRSEKRESGYFDTDPECRQVNWATLPMTLTKPMREHMFQKTVAAILVVIFLVLFSLYNHSLTNRLVDTVHYLTVHQMSPAEFVEQAKPVIQSVRDFNWRKFQNGAKPSPNSVPNPPDAEAMYVPVSGILASPYGTRLDSTGERMEMHYGIDVTADPGSPVFAAYSGTVSLIKEHDPYGLTIYLDHNKLNLVTIYGRVADVRVAAGDKVARGQQIASVAAAAGGESHLHFEVWKDRQPVDPEEFLNPVQ